MGQAMQWMTIDSAPKDGTPFLMFCPPTENLSGHRRKEDIERELVTTGYWDDYYHGWCLCVAWGYEAEQKVYEEPTHWMPLPSSPKADECPK